MADRETPPIAALFQVVFDQKVGYTISWKQTRPDTDLDGVEYQCLPSGLHGVREDVVYFIHGAYAGVSAFVQEEADKEHRNASFVAVGALVPLSYGRLGKSWIHVDALRSLAQVIVKNPDDKKPLGTYWHKHGSFDASNGAASPTSKRASIPGDLKRKRVLSDATGSFGVEEAMPLDHPASSMTALVTTFGPLLFPLYREAFLRRRILLLGSAPVQETCNFVYDLSIVSNVPQSLQESVSTGTGSLRLQALFNVGVFDITELERRKDGWIACTTDDILGEKKKLYDILVEMPPKDTASRRKAWPKLRTSDGEIIKATQRDLRRYTSLCKNLRKFQRSTASEEPYRDDEFEGMDDAQDDTVPLVRPSTQIQGDDNIDVSIAEADIVHPESWSAMAYKSFMWWASAGEMDALEADENMIDQALLDDLPNLDRIMGPDDNTEEDDNTDRTREAQRVATVLVAYFHRVTEAILQILAKTIDQADDDTEEGYDEDTIYVSTDDMRRMGVDAWNPRDRDFVQDSIRLHFKREASIEEDGIRMCGVRFC